MTLLFQNQFHKEQIRLSISQRTQIYPPFYFLLFYMFLHIRGDLLIELQSFMATRAKYTRVRGPEQKNEVKLDTDILMRFSDRYGKYVSRALTLFFGEGKNFVTIKAAERLMDRALWVAEVVRRKVEGLHQIVHVTERQVVDVYEPKEEGLVTVREERFLTILEVTLTREPTAEQKKHPGYHAPLNIKSDFLTKETWEQGEKQRNERRQTGGDRDERRGGDRDDRRGGERGERRERREPREDREPRENRQPREDRPPRRDNGRDNERGGERRRGNSNRYD